MTNLPIETQAALAITVGLCAWIVGAVAWEIAQQPWHRWVGRAAIGAGVLQLAAFANFAASRVEFLQFVQRGERVYESGSRTAEFATPGGHKFSIDTDSRQSATGIGYSSGVFATMGRTAGAGGRCGCCNRGVAGPDGRAGGLYTGHWTESRSVSPASPRRRVCECEQCTCEPCICDQLQAAAN